MSPCLGQFKQRRRRVARHDAAGVAESLRKDLEDGGVLTLVERKTGYDILERHFPVTVYFAAPCHSWQRGSNENFNDLLDWARLPA